MVGIIVTYTFICIGQLICKLKTNTTKKLYWRNHVKVLSLFVIINVSNSHSYITYFDINDSTLHHCLELKFSLHPYFLSRLLDIAESSGYRSPHNNKHQDSIVENTLSCDDLPGPATPTADKLETLNSSDDNFKTTEVEVT